MCNLHVYVYIFVESSVSQRIDLCSICPTSQAVDTGLRRGQEVRCAVDQTALQGGLVQKSNWQASAVHLYEAASPRSN